MVIGIDEAGRGCWAGPVVVCSFCFSPNLKPKEKQELVYGLKNSKALSQKKREAIFEKLINLSLKNKIYFGVGVVDSYMIDAINIRQANKEAMKRSLEDIFLRIGNQELVRHVLIDGKDNYEFSFLSVKPEFIIKGDEKIDEIKCASIIAKVFRDKLMTTYSLIYPQYRFEKHKSYGTQLHIELIEKFSITGIHRKSYKPIKNALK
ncbi:MAG: ribonuclease HII [Candidatus Gracilibacteria bacterium]|nr:ribonuclease HII [Candidatus Gracilibacteria bacterium]MDD3120660.1 ribonuclease HII [Candidatus Gracilibacteria bacterium]MDD4530820.1 ribonuclease HII [Candidatus Gracilibacteria bacterium]